MGGPVVAAIRMLETLGLMSADTLSAARRHSKPFDAVMRPFGRFVPRRLRMEYARELHDEELARGNRRPHHPKLLVRMTKPQARKPRVQPREGSAEASAGAPTTSRQRKSLEWVGTYQDRLREAAMCTVLAERENEHPSTALKSLKAELRERVRVALDHEDAPTTGLWSVELECAILRLREAAPDPAVPPGTRRARRARVNKLIDATATELSRRLAGLAVSDFDPPPPWIRRTRSRMNPSA